MTDEELQDLLRELRKTNHRKAAEVAYVLARLAFQRGDQEKALVYGRESIALFDKCEMDTIEDCAARFVTLGGITLPSLIHQDVVRDRLKPLEI